MLKKEFALKVLCVISALFIIVLTIYISDRTTNPLEKDIKMDLNIKDKYGDVGTVHNTVRVNMKKFSIKNLKARDNYFIESAQFSKDTLSINVKIKYEYQVVISEFKDIPSTDAISHSVTFRTKDPNMLENVSGINAKYTKSNVIKLIENGLYLYTYDSYYYYMYTYILDDNSLKDEKYCSFNQNYNVNIDYD